MSAVSGLLDKGKAFYLKDCFGAADREFTAAVTADPDSCEAYLWFGKNRTKMQDLQGALWAFEHALINASKDEQVLVILARTDAFEAEQDWASAVKDYSYIIAIRPNHIGARKFRARCFYKMSRFREAANEFEVLLDMQPDQLEHLLRKIAMLHSLGRCKEALGEISRGLSWFGERSELRALERELQEDQTIWDKLFG
jgi:tetratricopeptide (TPR) repeat protein